LKGLTDIPGIRVGHASDYDALTGCTAILCEAGGVAGVDIRGSASGTQEIDVLSPLHVTSVIHAITLSGGSAFGLEAASGVRKYLEQKGVGFVFGPARVPIVPSAILFDLGIGKPGVRPTREMGEAAAAAAQDGPVKEGAVGAGTGATVGKAFGMDRAMKSGLGTFTVELGGQYKGVLVSALAAVNAYGDVIDPATGKSLAGARRDESSRELVCSSDAVRRGEAEKIAAGRNTTLVVVATNARLPKAGATKLAQLAQIGLTRTVSPVNTLIDGDIVFAISCGKLEASVDALGVAAIDAVSQAIVRAVRLAPSLGGLPGLG
jgi:L-aminopeptidase/D-esterase-like protein